MQKDPKAELRRRIAALIGDDAADGVVEHLSSTFDVRVNNGQEIRRYLAELLGNSAEVDSMVESYISQSLGKVPNKAVQKQGVVSVPSNAKKSQQGQGGRSTKPDEGRWQSGGKADRVASLNSKTSDNNTSNGSASQSQSALLRYAAQSTNDTVPSETTKNRKGCGCLGTRHRFVGSCLSCGRACCEAEGLGPCPHCEGNMMSPLDADAVSGIPGVDGQTISAYKQKDKLMMFDRENAKRTHVHDAQADYYETGTWLSEEEKAEIEERDRQRREKMRPSNRSCRISFDIAGRRIIEAVDPEEDNDQPSSDAISASNRSNKSSNKKQDNSHIPRDDELQHEFSGDRDGDSDEHMRLHTVAENTSLSGSVGKAGEVYRLLRNSLVERVLKNSAEAGASKVEPAKPGSKSKSEITRQNESSHSHTGSADRQVPAKKPTWNLPKVDLDSIYE